MCGRYMITSTTEAIRQIRQKHPASGFYDWPKKEGGQKPAHYRRQIFKVAGQGVFLMAGLWRPWPTKTG